MDDKYGISALLATILPLVAIGMSGVQPVLAQPADTLVPTGSMTESRLMHTATLLQDGTVLIAGGYSPDHNQSTDRAELYDPATRTFSPTGSMMQARVGHAATRLPDGTVLITGGYTLDDAEVYNPRTRAFTPAGRMNQGRALHTATLLNSGQVLIAGGVGYRGPIPSGVTATAELYDPVTQLFVPISNMSTARTFHKAVMLVDGRVLIVPGSDGDDFRTAEIYEPMTNTFSSFPFANGDGSVAATADLLENGKVLITLQVAECDYPIASATVFDVRAGTFAVAEMMDRHCAQTSALLSDGRILIIGSLIDGRGPLTGAEMYDPDSRTFSRTGIMAEGRMFPKATLLNNGDVLISGGSTAGAEIYSPAERKPPPVLLEAHSDHARQGAVLHADTHELVSEANPALAGEVLEIYCTGLKPGSVVPPQISLDGRLAQVLFFGDAPGFAGLNQVNVLVPDGAPSDTTVPVQMVYMNRISNEIRIGRR